ncbi:hypothetical protein EDD99_2143 [Streptomyces sp. 846.5]|nr:hypothetical protein [Streptomyces sp. 846.5]TDU03703.1 hypothetical protein EDD99_2143 [Streptomyces sp. 846.5]
MSLRFQRGGDGTVTGTNDETGFTVTLSDEEEVKQLLYEDAGWPYPPPPPPVAPGHHRFTLVHDDYGCRERRFDDPLYDAVKASPPSGCEPKNLMPYFGLHCERPGADLLAAVTATVAELRSEYGLQMNDLGVEKVDEWSHDGRDGFGAKTVGHLLLMAAYRAERLGYTKAELFHLLDAAMD